MGKRIRNLIAFELRPKKDDDLKRAFEDVEKGEQSEVIRTALRQFFFKNAEKTVKKSHIYDEIEHFEPLKEKEIDDTELDAALDDLLKFD